MRGNDFIFDCVRFLYYKYHKVNPNRVESYIDSPGCVKIKIAKKEKIYPVYI